MATRKSTHPAPESSAKDRADNIITRPKTAAAAPVRAEWERASLKVRTQLADAIELLRKAAEASACETQAEMAVSDLGEMLGARMLPSVLAFLEAGPINNDRAAEGEGRIIDAVQISEALAGIAVGSPFESSMRAANELLMGALGALSDVDPWIGAPADAAKPRDVAAENVNHDDMADREAYRSFAFGTAHDICKVSSQIRAARALLECYEEWQSDADLTAVHIVLGEIEKRADELRDVLSDSHDSYEAKEAAHG